MLQWGHSDDGVEDARSGCPGCRRVRRFNGATPMMEWKTMGFAPMFALYCLLQWGHSDDGVEDGQHGPHGDWT